MPNTSLSVITRPANPKRRRNRRSRRGGRASGATVVVATKAKKPRRQRRRNNRRRAGSSAMTTDFNCYVNTLRDPFIHGPCRIGFGTMVPTNLYTAYIRLLLTCNGDGSCGVALAPDLTNMLYTQNAGIAVATWAHYPATNLAAIAAGISEGRVVSGGIRAIPQVPATSPPGIVYAGAFPALYPNAVTTVTPTTFIASEALHVGFGATGASAITLPVDPGSFVFNSNTIFGFAATTTYPTSTPVIIFTGLPASSTLLIEAVLNLEGIVGQANIGAITNPGVSADQSTLADHFPSLDNLWASAKHYIPTAATVNSGFSEASTLASNVVRGATALHRARRAFFPTPQTLMNRVTVEEME